MLLPNLMTLLLSAHLSVTIINWQEKIDTLLVTPPGQEQERLIDDIIRAEPGWQDVIGRLQTIKFAESEKGGLIQDSALCIDGVWRPFVVYVPSNYDQSIPIPLMVVLHGGISRPDIIENPKAWAAETPFPDLAEKRGYLMLFPFGQAGATWWDGVGMANILNLVRIAKQRYNIDDDRVYLGGFSDGASGAFLFAMAAPSDFAAFVALNGHMGVANQDGDLPTYVTNFYNSPVYAVTTDKDQLYPSSEMQKSIELAQKAGGKIYYRQLEGEHSMSYAKSEFPLIADFLDRHPRDPFPAHIIWETAISGFGVCRYFAIDEITSVDAEPWQVDYNMSLIDSSISIGFIPDSDFQGPGIRVAALVQGDFLARRIGLKAGDIIVKAGALKIINADDLAKFKNSIRRGDQVELVVKRGTDEVALSGQMPSKRSYYLFKRVQPSALARVAFSANKFDIESSRLGAFRILLHPHMINLNRNVIINVNGKEVFNGPVKPDIRYILRDFLENRDRKVIYINEVKIKL